MKKPKRKLTSAEKAAKKRRRKEYMTIFIHGKQKRVKCPPTIDGMDVDEFILRNADPIWLHQNGMWEYMIDYDNKPISPFDAPDVPNHEDDLWAENRKSYEIDPWVLNGETDE